MRIGFWWALAAIASAILIQSAHCEPASAGRSPPPIEAFFSRAALSAAALSPSGRYVAIVRTQGDASAVVNYDTQQQTTSLVLTDRSKDFNIDWLVWKGENRLVAGISHRHVVWWGKEGETRIKEETYRSLMVAFDRDGKNFTTLLERETNQARTYGFFTRLLDELRSDPDHILAEAPSSEAGLSVWRVNIHTGTADLIEAGDEYTSGWLTDRDGVVVGRFLWDGAEQIIQGRAPGEKMWRDVAHIRLRDEKGLSDFGFLGPTDTVGQQYVTVKPTSDADGPTRAVRIYDFKTHTLGPPLSAPTKYDAAGILVDPDTRALVATCYWIDAYQCDFKDPKKQATFRGLQTYFHGDKSIQPVSYSDDGRYWVLRVSGPSDPGGFYLYDWSQKSVLSLGDQAPDLPPERLGVKTPFVYTARDGSSIPGYVTRPPGAAPGPLPLVVIPHGGPEDRDDLDFDIFSQVIASRGYLVFQPNFRGSSGYGRAYAEAGYGQWGGKMQDDITDGVQKLIADGVADPKRICIFGASYGGYAALVAGGLHPELYKCVVSWAGISDLGRFVGFERGSITQRGIEKEYKLKAIGDPAKDTDRLARYSPVTYAPQYGPPVLLIHGEADTRVPLEQSQEMERALQAGHHDVRLLVITDEDHTDWEREHYRVAFAAVCDFIQSHISPAGFVPLTAASAEGSANHAIQ
jgi:dipeptidyl aminopeptidase/acylaminoacyl peptidase